MIIFTLGKITTSITTTPDDNTRLESAQDMCIAIEYNLCTYISSTTITSANQFRVLNAWQPNFNLHSQDKEHMMWLALFLAAEVGEI